jgi:hypothetical protein
MFYPQGNFYSSANLGYPHGAIGQQGFPGTTNGIPFANPLYGYPQPTPGNPQLSNPQLTPNFSPGISSISNWQHPAQLAVLQQQALQHLLTPQFAQPFMPQHSPGIHALNGLTNGAAQSVGGWQQPQSGAEQINPALLQQSQQQFLQRLVQYHYSLAQQFSQLAAQQVAQSPGNPYAGQFIPNQFGANFVPGITMH